MTWILLSVLTPSAHADCTLDLAVQGGPPDGPVRVDAIENHEVVRTWRVSPGPDGGVELADLPAGFGYHVTAVRDGRVPATVPPARCEGDHTLAGELVLRPADAWLDVQVVDEQGRPLRGDVSIVQAARTQDVLPGPATLATDADGVVRFGVRSGAPYNLYATSDGYQFGSGATFEVPAGATRDVRFELEPLDLVRGAVIDGQGQPVPGATVYTFPVSTVHATSGADGSFEIPLRTAEIRRLSAHVGDMVGTVEVEGSGPVRIGLRPGRTVSGQVVHGTTPVDVDQVVWSAWGSGLVVEVAVDEDGTFRARGVPESWPADPSLLYDPDVASGEVAFFVHDPRYTSVKVGLAPGGSRLDVPTTPR